MKKYAVAIALLLALGIVAAWFVPIRILAWAPRQLLEFRLRREFAGSMQRRDVRTALHHHHLEILEDVDASSGERYYGVNEPGTYFIKARIGGYRVGFRTDVVAFFVFDQQERLTRIVVKEYGDTI
jgi:mRNA-degrading endonuclease RelE of RelBE toxin-antitoxin system